LKEEESDFRAAANHDPASPIRAERRVAGEVVESGMAGRMICVSVRKSGDRRADGEWKGGEREIDWGRHPWRCVRME
jgi:hypothetical protein